MNFDTLGVVVLFHDEPRYLFFIIFDGKSRLKPGSTFEGCSYFYTDAV